MRPKNNSSTLFDKVLAALLVLTVILFVVNDRDIFYQILYSSANIAFWVYSQFFSLGSSLSGNMIFFPFVVLVIFSLFLAVAFPEPSRVFKVSSVLLLWLAHTIYIIFRTTNTLCLDTMANFILSIIMWLFEAAVYMTSSAMYVQLIFSHDRSKVVDSYARAVYEGAYTPLVDVFVVTYSEPLDVVKRTAVACQAMEYGRKEIYILDDGNRLSMKELSCELGCKYIARDNNAGAKAGNINNALLHTKGELIAVFDADCVPVTNFLQRTAGFFQDADMGLVIAAQAFYNADLFAHNVMSLMEQSHFFRQVQAGKDHFNSLLCFGTGFVVRRAVMDEVGGMPAETLSEDWALSIKIQAAGYRTYMVDQAMTAGAVAESMSEFVRQRVRWARGTLQSLFASTNPLTIPGLSLMQRWMHLSVIYHYIFKFFHIFAIVLPALYFFFGMVPFKITSEQFWIICLPFMWLNVFVLSWVSKEYTSSITGFISESFISLPLSMAAIKTFIRPFGWRFRVTKKGLIRDTTQVNWYLVWPQIFYTLLTICALAYGYYMKDWSGLNLFYFLFIWLFLRLCALWIGLYASCDLPQERTAVRFRHGMRADIFCGRSYAGEVVDISETGVSIRPDEPLPPDNETTDTRLTIPSLGIADIPVLLRRIDLKQRIVLVFKQLGLEDYRKLIKFLYCRPGQWDKDNHLDRKVFKSFASAFSLRGIKIVIAAMFIFCACGSLYCANSSVQDAILSSYFKNAGDPMLESLLEKMLASNHDLKRMMYSIERMNAEYKITRSVMFPQSRIAGSAGAVAQGLIGDKDSDLDFNISLPVSYELDVWKKMKARAQAAEFDVTATVYDRQVLLMTLTTELLQRYYLGRSLLTQINILENIIALDKQRKDIKAKAYLYGAASQDEIYVLEQNIKERESELASAQKELIRIEYSLKVLAGEPCSAGWLKDMFELPSWVKNTPERFPEDIIKYRPDLRALEARAASCGLRLYAKEKDAKPSFYLTATPVVHSNKINKMTYGENVSGSVLAQVTFPLSDGDRNKAEQDVERSTGKELAEQYQQTASNAVNEAQDAISSGVKQGSVLGTLEERFDFLNKELNIVKKQYDKGVVGYITVLEKKENIALQESSLLKERLQLVIYRIQLFRALGQGWWHCGFAQM